MNYIHSENIGIIILVCESKLSFPSFIPFLIFESFQVLSPNFITTNPKRHVVLLVFLNGLNSIFRACLLPPNGSQRSGRATCANGATPKEGETLLMTIVR